MEYYLALTKTEIVKFTAKYIELEKILPSEETQVQKDKLCTFSVLCAS